MQSITWKAGNEWRTGKCNEELVVTHFMVSSQRFLERLTNTKNIFGVIGLAAVARMLSGVLTARPRRSVKSHQKRIPFWTSDGRLMCWQVGYSRSWLLYLRKEYSGRCVENHLGVYISELSFCNRQTWRHIVKQFGIPPLSYHVLLKSCVMHSHTAFTSFNMRRYKCSSVYMYRVAQNSESFLVKRTLETL
jgi:hypothetical protein